MNKEKFENLEITKTENINKNPTIATITVGNSIIQLNLSRMTLTIENLDKIVSEVLSKKTAISQNLNGNWFPCGFANLWIDGKNPLVKFIKKNGTAERNGYFQLGKLEISKAYKTGYSVYLRYNGTSALEQQSLNFKTPLYQLLQIGLAQMGITSELRTAVD